MSEKILQGPAEEQVICVRCGLCCDATLFHHAHLNPGERGHLPEKIEQNSFSDDGKDYFLQPCQYFSGKCTIYDQPRADVCFSYRCQLLNDFTSGNISLDEARKIVSEAITMRNALLEDFRKISGEDTDIYFRKLLIVLGKKWMPDNDDGPVSPDYEILQARCNIFEALLVKYFRSTEDFEKLIMS